MENLLYLLNEMDCLDAVKEGVRLGEEMVKASLDASDDQSVPGSSCPK